MGNVVGKPDRRGNLYPAKQRPEQKIDAAVALMMAVGRAMAEDDGQGDLDGLPARSPLRLTSRRRRPVSAGRGSTAGLRLDPRCLQHPISAYRVLIRAEAGCPETLKRLPVSTTFPPSTRKIEKSPSM